MYPTDAVSFSRLRASQTPLLSLTEVIVHVGDSDNDNEAMFVHLVVKRDHTAVRVRLEKWTWRQNGTQIIEPVRHIQNVTGAIEIPLTDLPNTLSKHILQGRTYASQLSIDDVLTVFEEELNGESQIWGTTTHKRIK